MAVEAVSNQEEADNSAVGRERYTGGVDGMEVEERKYKHRGGGILLALEATRILMHKSEPGEMILVDDRNRLNETTRLEILWTVSHHWTEKERFAFNWYKH